MSYPAPCLLGNRLNAFRLNYVQAALWINIGGGWTGPGTGQDLLIDSLTINDRLNETPNTLIATVRGTTPVEGQAIRLAIGSQNGALLFAGTILRVTRVWAAQNPKFVLHHIEAIDPTWALNAVLFSARYRNWSATAIAADLLTRAPAGYTGAFEANLPILDEISMTNTTLMDAFVQLARRIGGYTRCDYDQKVYLFKTAPANPPLTITATHASVADVSLVRDLTQVVTRAVVEGGGGNALTTVSPGSLLIPVDVVAWYAPGGGYVRSGPQRIQYAGTAAGGTGAQVGTGVTPTTALAATLGNGSSALTTGTRNYAYTWVTASGETLPSPLATVTFGATPPPPKYGLVNNIITSTASHLPVGVYITASGLWSWGTSPTDVSAVSDSGPVSQSQAYVYDGVHTTAIEWSWNHLDDVVPAGATYLLVMRGQHLIGAIAVGALATGFALDTFSDAEVNARPLIFYPTAQLQRARILNIATGPSGTTARKIYRTAAGASQLKLKAALANNTATNLDALEAYDNLADASLGANAPTVDTSTLVSSAKQVLAGSTEIPVSSIGPFPASGYVLMDGSQVVRYGGVATALLTGVPASGPGSLTQSVAWGSVVTAAPMLTGIPASGVGAIALEIKAGDQVNLVVLVDDAAAQAALAAKVGGDGIRESLLQDGRIGIPEATARGRALLEAQMRPIETVAHRARDYRTRSGELVAVDLPAPTDIHGTYRIQDVQIANFHARSQTTPPTFTATSSSQRTSFDDLIRQIANTSAPPATGE